MTIYLQSRFQSRWHNPQYQRHLCICAISETTGRPCVRLIPPLRPRLQRLGGGLLGGAVLPEQLSTRAVPRQLRGSQLGQGLQLPLGR